jgi:hypothetical protein
VKPKAANRVNTEKQEKQEKQAVQAKHVAARDK